MSGAAAPLLQQRRNVLCQQAVTTRRVVVTCMACLLVHPCKRHRNLQPTRLLGSAMQCIIVSAC